MNTDARIVVVGYDGTSDSLVVVGSRGHHAVGEVLVGSVSRALLHDAACPVAVIH
jgi:nucleotide-binding universal stress UspA family protein